MSLSKTSQSERVRELSSLMAQMIGALIDPAKTFIDDDFVGPNYAKPSRVGEDAAHLFTKVESVSLDPVYT